MLEISKEAYKKCEVEIIIDKGKYFGRNRGDWEIESDYDNSAQIFDKFDPEKQKYRYKLMPNTEFQHCRRFAQNDLVETKILSYRKASKKFEKLKKKLGLTPTKLLVMNRIL